MQHPLQDGGARVSFFYEALTATEADVAAALAAARRRITFGEGSSGGGYRVEPFRQAVQASQRISFIGSAPPNGPTDVAGQPFPRAHQGHQGFVIDTGGFAPTASLSLVLDGAIPVLEPHKEAER